MARIRLKTIDEQIEDYRIGVEVGARKYRRKSGVIDDRFAQIVDELTKARRAARECAREKGWPTARWAHAIAIVNKAWSLSRQGVPSNQYEAELQALAVKLGMRYEDVVALLECVAKKGVKVNIPRVRR